MVQILENENFIQFADFVNCEVWLLNRTSDCYLDLRIVNIPEITESTLPSVEKLPKLLTEILNKNGNLDYQILTDNPQNFMIHTYVCEYNRFDIKEIKNYDESGIDC